MALTSASGYDSLSYVSGKSLDAMKDTSSGVLEAANQYVASNAMLAGRAIDTAFGVAAGGASDTAGTKRVVIIGALALGALFLLGKTKFFK
ncbi:MAG: hypothetical protein LBM92_03030 [Opitutaceae bacterium]|jgi:hypothetical protein|nr:hypothetical protein [Opitutaceae bacterium]